MKALSRITLCAAAVLFAAAAAQASTAKPMTIDQAVAKHIEAKGGQDAWDGIQSMRVTGEFTAFSKVSPFTLHRKRDRLFHLDHTMNDRRIIIGYDGEGYWWDNGFSSGGPQAVTGPADLAALEREIDFTTPLFDYEGRGFEATLMEGLQEIEGIPAIGIELKRADESTETWYLDPETFLELARVSPGSDFGRPMPSRTFFDEFRDVDGVQIPHYVETQWYTRDRVMDVAEVALNVDVDDSMFGLPVATGMEMFQHMVGEWDVQAQSKQSPRQPEFTESQMESVITASLNGGLIQERYASAEGTEATRTYSYDRFREHYVLTQMNEIQTFLDVQTGALEDGTVTFSNVESGTSFEVFGSTVHERSTLSNVTADGFALQREVSQDGGENWAVTQKLTYTRKGAETAEE